MTVPKRLIAAVAGAAMLSTTVLAGTASAASEPAPLPPVKVMTKNLYLGADVGVALDKLTNEGLKAAAQFMWDQVAATDFDSRVPHLAAEVVREAPDVIALQEATTWSCQKNKLADPVEVYNFTDQFLQQLQNDGSPYEIAASGGNEAFNPGFSIGPVTLGETSEVTDPDTFQPLFGQDTAICGFQIADGLLVRPSLSSSVTDVGTGDYEEKLLAIPGVVDIVRGYAWADVTVNGTSTRFVTTHLESMFPADGPTPGAEQARELAAALKDVTKPIVLLGDFNNDPRDPRPAGAPNPGGQPAEDNSACAAQVANPTVETADASCNAYWTMRQAGFTSVGPDDMAGANYTWGSDAELAGPDADRVQAAEDMGNPYGFTDRLDYIFVRGPLSVLAGSRIVGNQWPDGPDVWECNNNQHQTDNSIAMGEAVGTPVTTGTCFPTDHAGVVAQVVMTPTQAPALPETAPTATGTITAAPSDVAPGQELTVSAPPGSFLGGTPVAVGLWSAPAALGTLTSAADGSLSGPVMIPADAATGAHTLGVAAFDPTGAVVSTGAPITVTAAASPVEPPSGNGGSGAQPLPETGAGYSALSGAALSLIVVGMYLVATSRRRTVRVHRGR